MAPSLRGTLTVVEDQYHRESNEKLTNYRQQQRQAQQAAANLPAQHRAPVPETENWQQYPQNALPVKTLALAYVQGMKQQYTPNAMPLKTLTPAYMRGSGQQQHPQPMQATHEPYSPPAMTQPPGSPPSQDSTPYAYQPSPMPVPQQQQMYHYPVQQTAMQAQWLDPSTNAIPLMGPPANALPVMSPPTNSLSMTSPPTNAVYQPHHTPTSIPIADIAHLHGNQWTEVVEQRAHDFNHQSHLRANSYQQPTMPTPQHSNPANPAGMFDQVTMYQSAPALSQQTYQQTPKPKAQSLVYHPSFSNVTSAFPDVDSIYWSMQKGRGQQ